MLNGIIWIKAHLADEYLNTQNKTLLCFNSAVKINAIKLFFQVTL